MGKKPVASFGSQQISTKTLRHLVSKKKKNVVEIFRIIGKLTLKDDLRLTSKPPRTTAQALPDGQGARDVQFQRTSDDGLA